MEKRLNIRNFCIIAHIDHGKSTLADRILELTNSVESREMSAQILDNMDLERERGITIKSRAVTLSYKARDGSVYTFNLIDTPGHVDFNYEVSRSLAACEGAVLVVDASQGVEAQTLANTYLAINANLEIVPVINKVDLPSADPIRIVKEIEEIIGIPAENAPRISAKTGLNVEEVLECIVKNIPPPKGDPSSALRALVFDSFYDSYRGVVVYVRIVDGSVITGDKIKFMSSGAEFILTECGHLLPTKWHPATGLSAGEVGYFVASIKTLSDAKVGDTVTLSSNSASNALPGYRAINPMVFCGVYPVDGAKYSLLKDALEKLSLNDASLTFEVESSAALGFGFRCGFLGLLHMEIIQERLEREYGLDLMITAPSVVYKIKKTNGEVMMIDNPSRYPPDSQIDLSMEPITDAHIYVPSEYIGSVMEFCQERRGELIEIKYINSERVDINYKLPLNEIIYDFFDTLKSKTKGYASFDYEIKGYEDSDLVKLDIMLAGDLVDALSMIIHKSKAYQKGRKIAEKLKEKIPRQQFEVAIQACIGGKIIARETVKSFRKDVIAKCYGGDITRKRKLLEKQKEGKKRMRKFGSIEIPHDAFVSALKIDDK
ncbi:MAG: translation elongation factor 4 [Oscillospiraceae bacterium]|jgi:GTP-binding protein LepA|nr:translation elongation factor 4 [Oscillospiraceae bacterium]